MRAVAAIVLAIGLGAPVAAQWEGYPTPGIPRLPDGKPNLSGPVPKASDGKPDLSGIWLASRAIFDLRQAMKPGETIPLSPDGEAIFKQRQATLSKDDPSARCLPTGLPVRALLRTPFKILQTPGTTGILYESGTRFRQVLTDGRPLPKEIDWPTWQGFSVGKWEGDTFVITTSGFNGKAWLDQAGFPESDAMTITERLRRRDFGHMDMEMIVDDRKMYTKPWSILAQFNLQVDTELLEFICEENERDSAVIR
ncbi:MAG TPA: hypothetical protein VL475_00010 [Planctomycetaceae bacterium]|jgi:hypothetical protein|nr:hypothetical protein [Planctomycetaceae bacterium]